MANKKISQLTNLNLSKTGDRFILVESALSVTKSITQDKILKSINDDFYLNHHKPFFQLKTYLK